MMVSDGRSCQGLAGPAIMNGPQSIHRIDATKGEDMKLFAAKFRIHFKQHHPVTLRRIYRQLAYLLNRLCLKVYIRVLFAAFAPTSPGLTILLNIYYQRTKK
jgi:hypothetical protein